MELVQEMKGGASWLKLSENFSCFYLFSFNLCEVLILTVPSFCVEKLIRTNV